MFFHLAAHGGLDGDRARLEASDLAFGTHDDRMLEFWKQRL